MNSLFDFDAVTEGVKWASIDCRSIIQSTGGYADGLGKGSGWNVNDEDASEITGGAQWFMHAASKGTGHGNGYEALQFTNILADTIKDATKLFDVKSKDTGVCVSQTQGDPESGGIITYGSDWGVYTDNWEFDGGNVADLGGCLSGDGHHFCAVGRKGASFSNAQGYYENPETPGETSNCDGTYRNTIFWAWEDQSHGCGGPSRGDPRKDLLLIGTGCHHYNSNTPSVKADTPRGNPPTRAKMPPNRYVYSDYLCVGCAAGGRGG